MLLSLNISEADLFLLRFCVNQGLGVSVFLAQETWREKAAPYRQVRRGCGPRSQGRDVDLCEDRFCR